MLVCQGLVPTARVFRARSLAVSTSFCVLGPRGIRLYEASSGFPVRMPLSTFQELFAVGSLAPAGAAASYVCCPRISAWLACTSIPVYYQLALASLEYCKELHKETVYGILVCKSKTFQDTKSLNCSLTTGAEE